jgi:polysaccharide biosynthesis protein PslH
VFVANFAYGPNVDGALWLCRDVFPRVRAFVPGARLMLVGNHPPAEVRALAGPGVTVTGRVTSVDPYLEAADLFLCPLREGGGIKAKLLEALSRGEPVVTTSVGSQGLGPEAERALRIEDRSRGFARAVSDLLGDPTERRRLAGPGETWWPVFRRGTNRPRPWPAATAISSAAAPPSEPGSLSAGRGSPSTVLPA